MNARSLALVTLVALAACGKETEEAAEGPVTFRAEVADAGLQTPESVLHDATGDLYLVSNINGTPTDKDDNGFISRLTPDGQVQDLKWITGDSANVTLHAPKGMAIRGDTLYVADIDCVKMFVRSTGAPAGEVCMAGATFLNDVAVDASGALYVTDSGLNPDFSDSGTDAVWRFSPDGTTTKYAQGDQLGGPNGIAFQGDTAFVVTFGSGEIYRIAPDGARGVVLPGAEGRQLDGIELLPEGGYLFSSWGDSAVHRIDASGGTTRVVEAVESPADIGYDRGRNRVIVPLFTPNRVIIQELPPVAPPERK